MSTTPKQKIELGEGGVALYHCVFPHEKFEQAAQALFELVRTAQERFPGKPRSLYLDIEGHRNDNEGFDADMYELQKDFLVGFLMGFLSEVHLPLLGGKIRSNGPQNNDVPEKLVIEKREP